MLQGVWELIYSYIDREGGERTYPMGKDAGGRMIITEDTIMVQLWAKGRKNFASQNYYAASDAEMAEAFQTYYALCGRYTQSELNKTITVLMEGHLFPNWARTEQTRTYEFTEENSLRLTTPDFDIDGVQMHVVTSWRRAL